MSRLFTFPDGVVLDLSLIGMVTAAAVAEKRFKEKSHSEIVKQDTWRREKWYHLWWKKTIVEHTVTHRTWSEDDENAQYRFQVIGKNGNLIKQYPFAIESALVRRQSEFGGPGWVEHTTDIGLINPHYRKEPIEGVRAALLAAWAAIL